MLNVIPPNLENINYGWSSERGMLLSICVNLVSVLISLLPYDIVSARRLKFIVCAYSVNFIFKSTT